MIRVHGISDTEENGGGGKKKGTEASGRRPKPKPDYEWATNPDWDPF